MLCCLKRLAFPNGTGAVHCGSVMTRDDVLQKLKATEPLHHFFGGDISRAVSFI